MTRRVRIGFALVGLVVVVECVVYDLPAWGWLVEGLLLTLAVVLWGGDDPPAERE